MYTKRKRVHYSLVQKAHPPPHPTQTPASCSSPSMLHTTAFWASSPPPLVVALDSIPPDPPTLRSLLLPPPPDDDHDGCRALASALLAMSPNGLGHLSLFDAETGLVLLRNRNHPVAATPPATLETKAATYSTMNGAGRTRPRVKQTRHARIRYGSRQEGPICCQVVPRSYDHLIVAGSRNNYSIVVSLNKAIALLP